MAVTAAPTTLFASRMQLLGTEQAFGMGALIAQVEARGERVIRCNLGQPDFPLPQHIAAAVAEALGRGLTTYCDPQGLPELRSAIAREVGHTRGLDVDAERVVVFPGNRPPIGLAQHAYVEPGDEVVYPTPSYPLFESFIRYVGGIPVPVPVREEGGFTLTADDIAPLLSERTKLVYLNFPSNPTGGVATPDELRDVAQAIRARARPDVRVYSDESYEAIVFDGLSHASIASVPDMASRTIIASGASKTFSWTGGRVGWAVYPTVEEAKLHRNLNINYFASISPYNQIGAQVGLESPLTAPVIRAMVEAFQRRRDIVVAGLNAIEGVTCQKPKGAFYVFPNVSGVLERVGATRAWERLPEAVRTRTSPATMFQLFLLDRYRVATMDRRSFGVIGSEGQHYLRLSIANGEGDLRTAVKRIASAAQDVKGFQAYVREGGRIAH